MAKPIQYFKVKNNNNNNKVIIKNKLCRGKKKEIIAYLGQR